MTDDPRTTAKTHSPGNPSPDRASGRPPRSPVNRLGGQMVTKLLLARLALVWERAWPAFWPVVAVVGIFLTLALLDWLPVLPVCL